MKVVCDRAGLAELLNITSGVAVARTPRPVLSCVWLGAQEGSLTLAATDGEVSVRLSSSRVDVQEPGEALLPADKLVQIVRECVDQTLTLNTEGDVAHIVGSDSHFQVFGHSPEDFPKVPEFSGDPDFEIEAASLCTLLAQTSFATARENSRYAINGLLIERDGKKLTVVATDGRRLALAKAACKSAKTDSRSAIVPTKGLNLVARIFEGSEEPIRVKIADNQIMFATEDAVLSSTLVEGNFPPYKDVIPREGDKKVGLDKESLASAVRRAALLTNEESKGVRFAFDKDKLTLSSRAPEMGEAQVDVALPDYAGDPIEIGFNPQFILDALKVVPESQVRLELKAPNKPGVLRNGPDFLYVIMPVNLQP